VSEDTLSRVLEDAARSFKEHGFMTICFIGDHGGSQGAQAAIAEKLTREWRNAGVQVIQVSNYYSDNGQEEWLRTQGNKMKNPSAHAGFFDTAELLATDKRLVRETMIKDYKEADYEQYGVAGSPSGATETIGAQLLNLKVTAAVSQIRGATARR
jgi:creatinine amidohydrolase/Fe(II)-dependent formamide hydrolase-like protein